MRARRLAVAAAVLLALVLSGCGGSSPGSTPTSASSESSGQQDGAGTAAEQPSAATGELSFEVRGTCTPDEGTLTADGIGFTPNGPYTTEAWYPNGDPYTAITNPGRADDQGRTPNWVWPCFVPGANGEKDPPGEYRIRITDDTTDRSVETTLTVNEPR